LTFAWDKKEAREDPQKSKSHVISLMKRDPQNSKSIVRRTERFREEGEIRISRGDRTEREEEGAFERRIA